MLGIRQRGVSSSSVAATAVAIALGLVLPVLGVHAQAPMTLRQTLELRQPGAPTFSPDGLQLAYVVKQASLEANEWRHVLYVASAKGGSPRAVATAQRIGSVQWAANGRELTYLAKTGKEYQAWLVPAVGGASLQVTTHPGGIGAGLDDDQIEWQPVFRLAPDGRRALFFTRNEAQARRQLAKAWDEPLLYTEQHSYWDLANPERAWERMPAAAATLWSIDLDTGKEQRVWQSPAPGADSAYVSVEFDWAPDGKRIALLWSDLRASLRRSPLVILSADSFQLQDEIPSLGHTLELEWAADSRSVTFQSQGTLSPDASGPLNYEHYRYTLATRQLSVIPAAAAPAAALRAEIRTRLTQEVHDCTTTRTARAIACIREDSASPPEIAVYDVSRNRVVGHGRVLTNLNPELAPVRLGEVRPVRGRSEDGVDSGLILPVGYVPGRRYPLVVMLYNQYHSYRFTGKPDIFSYAPQVFAGHGYVVLLQNLPLNSDSYPRGNFAAARAVEADGVALSLRSMLDSLIEQGVADPRRMGIMGWSMGGFLAPYILTHYPQWFQAGAMGEGGIHQPTAYWLGGPEWRDLEDRYYGSGGPYGPHADRWRAVAPIFNVDKLRAPLLMEYGPAYLQGLDLYRAIVDQGKQAELYVYRNERHIFDSPANIYASMQRHLDWFNFWLLDEEDAARKDQYDRWLALRQQRERSREAYSDGRE